MAGGSAAHGTPVSSYDAFLSRRAYPPPYALTDQRADTCGASGSSDEKDQPEGRGVSIAAGSTDTQTGGRGFTIGSEDNKEPEEREERVSTLELFFDLVFVFTLTQLTGVLAGQADAQGLAKVALLLSVTWWMYDGYAWLTNALEVNVSVHRLLLLGGMGGFLIMSLAIPTTFDGGGVVFGIGFLVVVVLHSGLYLFKTSDAEARAFLRVVPYNVGAALLLIGGGVVGGGLQWWLMTIAGLLVWSQPFFTRLEGFHVAASHFVERHGLLVIVALGESIVVLGVGAGGRKVDLQLAVIALLGLGLSASLWWIYFRDVDRVEVALHATHGDARPRLAIGFGYLHFAVLLGVVLVAAGLKKATEHPFDRLEPFLAVALAAGTGLFLAAQSGMIRVVGMSHGSARPVAVVVALATVPLGALLPVVLQVGALAAVVTGVAILDSVHHHAPAVTDR